MILSVSRRTDIPAFYVPWFLHRIHAGFCLVPNPFRPAQVARVSLDPPDVDAFVFWSKNPDPLLPHLAELEARGYRFYFQFTLTGYDQRLEPNVPPLAERLATFRALARQTAPWRIVWRYDPIVLSSWTPPAWHRETFRRLAEALAGSTTRVVVSLLDVYRKARRRLAPLAQAGNDIVWAPEAAPESWTLLGELAGFTTRVVVSLLDAYRKTRRRLAPLAQEGNDIVWIPEAAPESPALLGELAAIAHQHGLCIQTCAERPEFQKVGVPPGACIDPALLVQLGRPVALPKDPGQRPLCLCVTSRDPGMPDSCLHGCHYCYATQDPNLAHRRHQRHDPTAPMLIPAASG